MNPNFISLEEIRIAKPCRADWQNMTGDERARFCGSCHKNVYDISQMTRAQAHKLIAEKEGNLCLRLHRRPDGTVITSDCPVGSAATPRPLWWGVAALVALVGSGLAGCALPAPTPATLPQIPALGQQKVEVPQATPIQVEAPAMEIGKIAAVPITNGSAHSGQISGVTLGVPMMPNPTPQSAPTPYPTNAPPMGEPTMGEVAISSTGVETMMGDMALVCEKPR